VAGGKPSIQLQTEDRSLSAEEAFLNRLRRGEHDAYEELVRRFEGPLYRYFLAAHGDPQLAGEQSADCFGNLVESLPKMTGGPDQLTPFVYAVARNVLRRAWRRRRRFAPFDSAMNVVDHQSAPDMQLESKDEGARVICALQLLDPATREIFLLRFVELMSVVDVAATVGEPIGTVKSRLHRGRQRLAQLLRPESRIP
jgi:RNA polymerase sigma-70 factor (ECF subfamily)